MKYLKPNILTFIGILGNETLDKLKRNVCKYEHIKFTTTGNIHKNQFEIESAIIQNTNRYNKRQ